MRLGIPAEFFEKRVKYEIDLFIYLYLMGNYVGWQTGAIISCII